MRMRTKVWLIIAASLVLIGCILFAGVMSTVKYESNDYEISEAFDCISINTDAADIVFAVSDSGNCKVECYEEEKSNHLVTIEENTLVIKMIDSRSWYDHIGVNFGSPKIIVYLPQTEYASLSINESTGDVEIPKDFIFNGVDIALSTGNVNYYASASETVKIKTSTGNICVEDISAGALDLSLTTGKVTVSDVSCDGDVTIGVSTGKTYLTDARCKSVISSGNTGGISLNNVIAAEKLCIERSTGDVEFNDCDATEIFIETDTGDVTGTLLTEKVFITKTDTGNVDVPKTVNGGSCEISTDTGDIKISVKKG